MPPGFATLWPPEDAAIRHYRGSTVRATSRFSMEERWGERLNSCMGDPLYFQAKWDLPHGGVFKDADSPELCRQSSGRQPFGLVPAAGGFGTHGALMDGALPGAESLGDLAVESFPRFLGWLVTSVLSGHRRGGVQAAAFSRVTTAEEAAGLAASIRSALQAVVDTMPAVSAPAAPMSQLQKSGRAIGDSASLGDFADPGLHGGAPDTCGGTGPGAARGLGSGPAVDPCVMDRRGAAEEAAGAAAARTRAGGGGTAGALPPWAWRHLVFVTHRGSALATARTADSLGAAGPRRVVVDASAGASLFARRGVAAALAGLGGGGAEALASGASLVDPLTSLSHPMALEMSRRVALRAGAAFFVLARAGSVLAAAPGPGATAADRAAAMGGVLAAVAAAAEAAEGGRWGVVDLSCLVLARRRNGSGVRACEPGQRGPLEAVGVPPVLWAVSAAAARAAGAVDPYTHSLTAAVADWTARVCRAGLPVVRATPRRGGGFDAPARLGCGAGAAAPTAAGRAWAWAVTSGATYWPRAAQPDEPRVEEAFGERLVCGFGSQVYLRVKWGRWGDPAAEAPWRSTIASPFGGLGNRWLTDPPRPPNHQPKMEGFLSDGSQADVLAVGRMVGLGPGALDRLSAAEGRHVRACRRAVHGVVERWLGLRLTTAQWLWAGLDGFLTATGLGS